MDIDIITLFPKMFNGPFAESILQRAQDASLVKIKIHNLRNWAIGSHKMVDDRPYGGGCGMVLMIEPIFRALEDLKREGSKVILLTPQGKTFKQAIASELSKEKHLIFIAGHYEGFDERIRKHLINMELSIGDYVLTGGEIPAMVIIDCVIRLIPGVLKDDATAKESFAKGILEYPQYTRPENFNGWKVPDILLSGHHQKIEEWQNKEARSVTRAKRPELLAKNEI